MQLDRRTIREGLLIGAVAYLAVVAFYSVFDILAARDALFTADMVGRAVFKGMRDPAVHLFPHQLDLAAVLCCGGLHLPLSMMAGLGAAAVVDWGERRSVALSRVVLVLAAGGGLLILGVGLLLGDLRPVLPWSSILVANALGLATAASLLVRRRQAGLAR